MSPLEQERAIATMQYGLVYDYSERFVHLYACGQSLFTGKERDTESGNDYFGARYYSSTMGRFLSPDWSAKAEPVPYAKLDNPQSLNLYSYMRNDPLGGVDPDGHWPDWLNKIGQRFDNLFRGDGFVTNMNLKSSVSFTQMFSLPVVHAQEEEPEPVETKPEMVNGAPLEPLEPIQPGEFIAPEPWSIMNPGPLGDGAVAQSFAGGRYSEFTIPEGGMGFDAYRVWGGDAKEDGSIYSLTPQNGGIQSMIDLALRPEWGNTAENVTCVSLPAGTVTYVGQSASQGDFYVRGGVQMFVPKQ